MSNNYIDSIVVNNGEKIYIDVPDKSSVNIGTVTLNNTDYQYITCSDVFYEGFVCPDRISYTYDSEDYNYSIPYPTNFPYDIRVQEDNRWFYFQLEIGNGGTVQMRLHLDGVEVGKHVDNIVLYLPKTNSSTETPVPTETTVGGFWVSKLSNDLSISTDDDGASVLSYTHTPKSGSGTLSLKMGSSSWSGDYTYEIRNSVYYVTVSLPSSVSVSSNFYLASFPFEGRFIPISAQVVNSNAKRQIGIVNIYSGPGNVVFRVSDGRTYDFDKIEFAMVQIPSSV